MSLVDSTCIVRSLKAGLFDDGWYPGVFGSRRAVQLDAEFGCYTDAALDLNGATGYAQKGSPTFPATTGLVFAIDAKPTALGVVQTILGRWDNVSNQFLCYITVTGELYVFIADAPGDGGNNYNQTTTGLAAGVNTRVLVVYDGTQAVPADRVKIYFDGAVQPVVSAGTIPASLVASTAPVSVGSFASGGGPWGGTLKNLSFSSDALSGSALDDAHVSKMWSEMSPEEQARWFSHFDLCQRTGTLDDATGLNDLTRVNSPGVAQGPTGKARLLNGVNQYFSRASEAALNVDGSTSFTIAMWINPSDTSGRVWASKDDTASDRSFLIYTNANTFVGGVWDDAGNLIIPSIALVPDGQHHLVTMSWSVDDERVRLSVDGGAETIGGVCAAPLNGDCAEPFAIGANHGGNLAAGSFCRTLFTKRLLTDAERRDLYRGGEGRLYANLPASLIDSNLVFCLDGTETDNGTLVDQHAGLDFTAVNSPTSTAGPGLSGPCVDRSPCKRIEDGGPHKRHFIQPTMTKQPDWGAEYQNGLGALVFDGVDDYMYAEFSLIPAFETWVVGKFTGPRVGNNSICAAVRLNTYRLLRSPDADTMRAYTGVSLYAAMGPSGPESFHLYRASWAASGLLSVDSDPDNTGADLSGSHVNAAGYVLGARGGGPGLAPAEFGPCAISSLLLLSAVPTDAEAINAKRYYRTRYGTP